VNAADAALGIAAISSRIPWRRRVARSASTGSRIRNAERPHVLGLRESRVDPAQRLQAADHQPGTDEQYQR
jgi:hypothetical protein